jgi:4-amino-4-deoxy-L-arabinose transferase
MLFVGSSIFFMFIAHFIVPDLTIAHKAPGKLLLSNSHRIQPDTILVSGKDPVCAVCWFYKRSDVYLLEGGAGELSYGLHYNDSKHRLLSLNQLRELILKNRGTGRVTLVAKARKYNDWKKSLPEPLFEDSSGNGGFMFAQF